MEKEILDKQQFNSVEVPNFLFDKISDKIENLEQKSNFQSKLLLAAAIIIFFVNIGIVGKQQIENRSISETEFNPYATTTYSTYD